MVMTVACPHEVVALGRGKTQTVRIRWRELLRAHTYRYHVSCLYLPAFSMLSR
jgi:hypothetical protein